jgi:hypothetical protein
MGDVIDFRQNQPASTNLRCPACREEWWMVDGVIAELNGIITGNTLPLRCKGCGYERWP